MQYPAEYITALIIISAAFVVVAGIVLALIAGKDDDKRSAREKKSIFYSACSIAFGIISMIFALNWFSTASDTSKTFALTFLIIQFILFYLPLLWLGFIEPFISQSKKN
jgi:uncharacterized membrane protein